MRQLAQLRLPGGNDLAERSQDLQAMGNGPAFGPPHPLSLGQPSSPSPSAPGDGCPVTSPRTGSLPTPFSRNSRLATSVLKDVSSMPSSPKGNRSYPPWPLGMITLFSLPRKTAAPSPWWWDTD